MGNKKQRYEESQDENKVTLEDFIIPQKIKAFTAHYKPANRQTLTTIAFDDSRLREFFKAWITKVGDPLAIYVERLEALGYVMTVGIMGEPVIIVEEKV